jgi:hypothetical protein
MSDTPLCARLQTALDRLLGRADEHLATLARAELPNWNEHEAAQTADLAAVEALLPGVCAAVAAGRGADWYAEAERRCRELLAACRALVQRTRAFQNGFAAPIRHRNQRLAACRTEEERQAVQQLYLSELGDWGPALADASAHDHVMEAAADVLRLLSVAGAVNLPAADGAAVFLPLHMAAKGVGLEESQLSTLCKSGAVASREPTEREKELYGGKIKRMVSVPDAQREAAQRRGQFRGARKPLDE